MEDKTLFMTLLLDVYGELLTQKQRYSFEMHYNEDLSLAEIAESLGISRQGVRDLIVRSEAILVETEKKLGFLKRLTKQRETIASLDKNFIELKGLCDEKALCLVEEIKEKLEELTN